LPRRRTTRFIALLCDLGADIDLADLQGNTPLHYAQHGGNTASVRALLSAGKHHRTQL
jgi:ankyrin repeat protein